MACIPPFVNVTYNVIQQYSLWVKIVRIGLQIEAQPLINWYPMDPKKNSEGLCWLPWVVQARMVSRRFSDHIWVGPNPECMGPFPVKTWCWDFCRKIDTRAKCILGYWCMQEWLHCSTISCSFTLCCHTWHEKGHWFDHWQSRSPYKSCVHTATGACKAKAWPTSTILPLL